MELGGTAHQGSDIHRATVRTPTAPIQDRRRTGPVEAAISSRWNEARVGPVGRTGEGSRGRSLALPVCLAVVAAVAVVAAGCSAATDEAASPDQDSPSTSAEAGDDGTVSSTTSSTAATTSSTTEPPPRPVAIEGVVLGPDGEEVAEVVVAHDGAAITPGPGGSFGLTALPGDVVRIRAPGHRPVSVEIGEGGDGQGGDEDRTIELDVELEPLVVRGLRASRLVTGDPDLYQALLDQADATVVNSLVFDTKDESGSVLYRTEVDKARELGAIDVVYDPAALLAQARDRGLYTITRIVTFEDGIWADGDPEAKLAGNWVDASDRANWDYPLALAVEACQLGFDEIQFDYVRYPAGTTARVAADRIPTTGAERTEVIGDFLAEARARLVPLGCGLSAAIFGIVVSSPTDEGIGQSPEALTPHLDAVSPMVYPSHYGAGWLGFPDPNEHPGPVVADAIDDGLPRLADSTRMRPWLQAFYYDGAQVQAGIAAAEDRGAGWLLWNASGRYRDSWLPTG